MCHLSSTDHDSPRLDNGWLEFPWSGILGTQAIEVFHRKMPNRIPVKPCFYHTYTKVTLKDLGWKMIRSTAFGFGDVHGIATWMSMELSN